MKLYSLPHSPYAARVRMQARMENLALEILPPPVPLRTEAFLDRFPLGKVPVLELDSGETIAESWAIMEYLAEAAAGGGSTLLPDDALARAQMRMVGRYADLHLAANALFPLFRATMGGGKIDAAGIAGALHAELAKGERLFAGFAPGRPLNLGDLALAPTILYLQELAPVVGVTQPLKGFAQLEAWWDRVNGVGAIRDTLKEVRVAYHSFVESLAAKA